MKLYTNRGFGMIVLALCWWVISGPYDANALDFNGIIDADTNWTLDESPVTITGEVLVARGVVLTIQPGVEVIFQPRADTERGYNITVEGTLDAQGTDTDRIIFMPEDRTLPWGSIIFQDSSEDWDEDSATGSVLSFCVVEYGGNASDEGAMISTHNAMPLLASNTIRFSSSAGISVQADAQADSSSGDIRIVDNQIYSNTIGLFMDAEGGVVSGNYFLHNVSAVNISTRSNPIEFVDNTIAGSSDELFGSGLLLSLGAPENSLEEYSWKQTGGKSVDLSNASAVRPTFLAPDPGDDLYELAFQLTVTGKDGDRDTDSVAVTITGSNRPPVADAGGDQDIQRLETTVTLSGAGSYDPDSSIAAYRWAQESGRTVTLQRPNTPTAAFAVPGAVTAGEQMSFTLTVTDDGGIQSSDTVAIRYYQDNIYPVSVAGGDITAMPGETVSLNGSASSDADGEIVTYLWDQAEGTAVSIANEGYAHAYFKAPDVGSSGEEFTFQLTVTDSGGLSDTDEVVVRVSDIIADSGADQSVFADQQVTLDGSASVEAASIGEVSIEGNEFESEGDGAGIIAITAVDSARYWLLATGNNISFSDASGYGAYLFSWYDATATLQMPDNWWGSADPETIDDLIYDNSDDFQLPSVSLEPFSDEPLSDTGSDLDHPSLAYAGPDLQTGMDLSVTLDGSDSHDPDGTCVYLWEQTEGPTVSLNHAGESIADFIAPSGGLEGETLAFRLTVTSGDSYPHTDTVQVYVVPNEEVPMVEVGGGCFLTSVSRFSCFNGWMIPLAAVIACLFGVWRYRRKRQVLMTAVLVLGASFISVLNADAGFFAVGGGGGGDADQYNITMETGAKDITVGKRELMFSFGIPFIPHGDDNIPPSTIATPCPNDECRLVGEERKGTEVGFYGKLGIEIGSTNLYVNAIGGFTVYTESRLVESPGSGAIYEDSTDTTIEPLYGGGLSYFPDTWDVPILFQIDYDITRGVTGTIGWYW